MKIALIFNKEREDVVGVYFARALDELGYRFDHFWTKDALAIRQDYDLYLRIDHGDYKYDIPHELHPSAFYVVDTHLQHSYRKIKKQIGHFDFVFCAQNDAAIEFKNRGVNSFWLPLACDPLIHCKLNLSKYYDIAFVGTDGGVPRKLILQELRERFPSSFICQAPFTEMSKIYSQAKIGFHFIAPQSKHTDHVSMRVYEIMSCGTMLLANQIKGESLDMLGFYNKKHLVLYKNIKEIFLLIEYYLKNDSEREKIADRGHKLVLARHTYRKRMEEILDIVNKNKKDVRQK